MTRTPHPPYRRHSIRQHEIGRSQREPEVRQVMGVNYDRDGRKAHVSSDPLFRPTTDQVPSLIIADRMDWNAEKIRRGWWSFLGQLACYNGLNLHSLYSSTFRDQRRSHAITRRQLSRRRKILRV